MARVEGLGEAGHVLGHEGAKDLMPCRQEESCGRGSSCQRSRVSYQLTCFESRVYSLRKSTGVHQVSEKGPRKQGAERTTRRRTKSSGRQDPFVEQDDAGAEGDPKGDIEGRMKPASGAGRILWRRLRQDIAVLELPILLGGGTFACHLQVGGPTGLYFGSKS